MLRSLGLAAAAALLLTVHGPPVAAAPGIVQLQHQIEYPAPADTSPAVVIVTHDSLGVAAVDYTAATRQRANVGGLLLCPERLTFACPLPALEEVRQPPGTIAV